jgi:hypothetical protein
MSQKFQTFGAFWPFYLQEHSKPLTRRLHVIGTACALASLVSGILMFNIWMVLLALVFGYGFAWIAHLIVEKNRPATFTHPFWSLRADFIMFWLWLNGGLEAELKKHNITV